MDNTPPSPAAASTELARIEVPEVVDFEVIRTSIAPSVDKMIARANATVAKLAAGIKDDETRDLAVREAENLRDNGEDLFKRLREEFYMDAWYRPGEERREVFDSRLKPIASIKKALLAQVSDYNERKERQAKLAREKADAEARRQREAAERAQREAEEAERRAKAAAEDEKRRKLEAEEAEKRRIVAEAEAKARREREAREAAAAETARKLKEEEDARVKHAEVAQAEGNGAAKVDTILESATPISPVLGAASAQAKDAETLRLEQEQARKVADEKAALEREAAAEAERRRQEAEAEAFRAREAADAAKAAATSAAAAAAAVDLAKPADDTTGTTRWVWDLDSDGTVDGDRKAFVAVIDGVLQAVNGTIPLPRGFDPLTFLGFDENKPADFRPAAITKAVTDGKDNFKWPGIKAWPQRDERLKRRVVGGRR